VWSIGEAVFELTAVQTVGKSAAAVAGSGGGAYIVSLSFAGASVSGALAGGLRTPCPSPAGSGASMTHLLSGILLSAAGIGVLSAMDATAKSLGASLSPFQIGFVRYLGAALWLIPVIAATRGAWPQRRNLRRHALRAALMALTAALFFHAIVHLPLAIATALW